MLRAIGSGFARVARPMGLRASSGHVADTPGSFKEREHAVENQYFNKEELAQLEKLKKQMQGAADKAAAGKSPVKGEVPTIQHGQAYVSLETFYKFSKDVLKSLQALEEAAKKK